MLSIIIDKKNYRFFPSLNCRLLHFRRASSSWFFWLVLAGRAFIALLHSGAVLLNCFVPYRHPSMQFTIVATKFLLRPAQILVRVVSGISLSRSVSRLFKNAAQCRASFSRAVRPIMCVLTSEVLPITFVSITVAAFAVIRLVRNRRRYSVVQVQVSVASGHYQFSNSALSSPVCSSMPVIRSSFGSHYVRC